MEWKPPVAARAMRTGDAVATARRAVRVRTKSQYYVRMVERLPVAVRATCTVEAIAWGRHNPSISPRHDVWGLPRVSEMTETSVHLTFWVSDF